MVSYEQNIIKEKYGLVKYYGLDSARATLNAGLETGSKYIATDTGLTYIFQAYYKSKTNKTIVGGEWFLSTGGNTPSLTDLERYQMKSIPNSEIDDGMYTFYCVDGMKETVIKNGVVSGSEYVATDTGVTYIIQVAKDEKGNVLKNESNWYVKPTVSAGGGGNSDIQSFFYDSVGKCVKLVAGGNAFSADIPEELNDADLINKITLDATHGTLLYDGNPISGFTQAQMNLLNKLGENANGELMFDGKEVNVMTPVEKESLDKIVNNVIVNEDPATGEVTVELGELVLEAKKDVTGNVEGLLVNGMDVLIQEPSAPDTSLDDALDGMDWL